MPPSPGNCTSGYWGNYSGAPLIFWEASWWSRKSQAEQRSWNLYLCGPPCRTLWFLGFFVLRGQDKFSIRGDGRGQILSKKNWSCPPPFLARPEPDWAQSDPDWALIWGLGRGEKEKILTFYWLPDCHCSARHLLVLHIDVKEAPEPSCACCPRAPGEFFFLFASLLHL